VKKANRLARSLCGGEESIFGVKKANRLARSLCGGEESIYGVELQVAGSAG